MSKVILYPLKGDGVTFDPQKILGSSYGPKVGACEPPRPL
jgi:hypothetical protein